MDAAGCLQLCAGQRAGCEAAVHAMQEIFDNEGIEGLLLVTPLMHLTILFPMMLLMPSVLFLNSSLKLSISARLILRNPFFPTPLLHCVELLSGVRRKVRLLGSPLSRLNDTGLLFIRQTSLMLFVCVMAGFHPTYLPTVSVAKPFLFPMLLAALMVLFPLSAIMTFAT